MKGENKDKMEQTLKEIQEKFISSSQKTEQYKSFHKLFSKEFKKLLKPYCKEILIHKTNHFDINGFFKLESEKIYYFSISDLRWSKDNMLIRTAENFKDYSGGGNNFINLDENFKENLLRYLRV